MNVTTLGEILDHLKINSEGVDRLQPIKGLAFSEDASSDTILVIHQPAMMDLALRSSSKHIFADEALAGKVPEALKKKFIFVKNPYLVFAKISQFFGADGDFQEAGVPLIHPSAVISPKAKLGNRVVIGANVMIYPEAEIGDGTQILANCVIGQGVKIGQNSRIFPNTTIYPRTVIGSEVRIHANCVLGADGFGYAKEGMKNVKISHLGKLILEDNVEIGASTCIDRGTLDDTIVRRGVVIDNNVQIGHNCKIGEDSVICGMVGIPGGVVIGKCVTVGGLSGFNNKVKVGDFSQIGGMTGVSKDIPAHAKVIGRPMKSPREYHEVQVLVGRLPELYKRVKELERELAKD